METREIIAYLLLAGIFAALVAVYLHFSRDHRAHGRAHKAANRRNRERARQISEGS